MDAVEIPLEAGHSKNATVRVTAIVHPALCAYRVTVERYIQDDDGPLLEEIIEEFPTLQEAYEKFRAACREAAQFALWEQELTDGA